MSEKRELEQDPDFKLKKSKTSEEAESKSDSDFDPELDLEDEDNEEVDDSIDNVNCMNCKKSFWEESGCISRCVGCEEYFCHYCDEGHNNCYENERICSYCAKDSLGCQFCKCVNLDKDTKNCCLCKKRVCECCDPLIISKNRYCEDCKDKVCEIRKDETLSQSSKLFIIKENGISKISGDTFVNKEILKMYSYTWNPTDYIWQNTNPDPETFEEMISKLVKNGAEITISKL